MGWEYWNWVSWKKTFLAMGSVRLRGSIWRLVAETIYWHISKKIRWNQGWSQYLREWGTKMSFSSLSDGFLPKSSVTCSNFFFKLVIRREENRPEQRTAYYFSAPSLCLLERRELPDLLPWTCHLKATLSLCFLAGDMLPLPTLPDLSQMAGLIVVAWL